MNRLLELDLQARTELLAYLVALQLVARQKTGQWLKPGQLIESTRLWLRLNGRRADWLQRVTLACRTQRLAEQLERTSPERFDARSLARMFFCGVRLDWRSQVVIEIFVACVANLPGEIVFHRQGG
ncbi:hypothetical protein P0D71_11960 [Paraburkholderia sp. RL17-383-BIF-A]|jgi:hypothetical protein|uniref:hypothetical protein n=1 Tax=Burkholderiaceae TaxID=119060 RepID=UPI0008948D42|nr:hypothetical protein [Burkholderia sp. WP9]SEE76727.1 hypothetical protein SAMN02787142_4666 [Burkholderia sp. WP9]